MPALSQTRWKDAITLSVILAYDTLAKEERKGVAVFEDAARCRARESALLRDHGHEVAAVYPAGYVIECRLKALLQRQGTKFPTAGSEGHNLIALWDKAGLRSRDLVGAPGTIYEILEHRVALPAESTEGN